MITPEHTLSKLKNCFRVFSSLTGHPVPAALPVFMNAHLTTTPYFLPRVKETSGEL